MTNDSIIAYVGTIIEYIQGMTEEEVREIVMSDIRLMDGEMAAYTMEHFEEIIAEAMDEME